MTIALPTTPQVQRVLEVLVQESVVAPPCSPPRLGQEYALAVYSDDLDAPRAAWLVPVPLAAWLSATLLGMPPARALEEASTHELSSQVQEAFAEVCNVLGTLANGPAQPRLRLTAVHLPGDAPGDLTEAWESAPGCCGFSVEPSSPGTGPWTMAFALLAHL